MQDDSHYDDENEPEEIEAYCVRCRQTVVMLEPSPVWTKRGAPGTRGVCDICGSTIFRMGWTDAHRGLVQPDVSQFREIAGGARGQARGRPRQTAYINYAPPDAGLAARLADDLAKMGIPTWVEGSQPPGEVSWASGVHPALEDCSHMVVVLSGAALASGEVRSAWQHFRERRKPTLIAQAEACAVPDELRRSPRFDFSQEYKTAFRELLQALAV